ncbi:hypothetical protein [Agromyces silvae]|uniref:hypothetical protein n=1 Tax=Agromyces silvae TaxID=3388266 RepID=UPI00280B15EE|nr:hypothetical protein [Agromyces protaetiae]
MTRSRFSTALVLAAALVSAVGLTACTDTDTADTGAGAGSAASDRPSAGAGAPSPTVPEADGGVMSAFRGLYVTADVALVAAGESSLMLASSRSCDDLSAMLAAGEWRTVDRLSFGALGAEALAMLSGFGGVAGELLQRGDALAFAAMDGGSACTATVAPVSRGDLTLEGGGLPGAAPGWVATTQCMRSTSTGDLIVSVYFDTDANLGGQGQVSLLRSGDGYAVSADDSSSVNLHLLQHGDRFLQAMTDAYATASEPPLMPLEPGDAFSGEATVHAGSADASPAGEIVLRGLVDVNTYESEITIGLPFACPGVVETA